MTQPLLAHQTSLGRMYSRTVDGLPEVPSITTVISRHAVDMTGWAGHMAATAVINDARLAGSVGNKVQLKQIARQASSAAEKYRDEAAARGDRVHNYAEHKALRELGRPHEAAQMREKLQEHGEGAYADRFDEWWDLYGVKPIEPEVTIWNHTVGYAGTLDLVAEIGGVTCLIDYKTRGTTRDGRVKAPDPKVVMQLAAGAQAEEYLSDPENGTWEPWPFPKDSVLLAVALGETEVLPMRAQPHSLENAWKRFWALRQVWETESVAFSAAAELQPVPPPTAHSMTPHAQ